MTSNSAHIPDVTRPDGGFVLVAEWSATEQQAAADAAIDAWDDVPWPNGLLNYACLLGLDHEAVLHVSQWSNEAACKAFVAAERAAWASSVDASAPGILRQGVTGYQLYRGEFTDTQEQETGCVVTVTINFDGPDIERARGWIDGMFDSFDDTPVPGMIGAHFHVSTDGARVLNYAQWTDAASHQAYMQGGDEHQEDGEDSDAPYPTAWPGLTGFEVKHYRPYRGLSDPSARS